MLWPFLNLLELLFLLQVGQVVLTVSEEHELSVAVPRETTGLRVSDIPILPCLLFLNWRITGRTSKFV